MSPTNWLNPGAGDVPLPDDPREVEAALRAGRRSWRLVPYYGWRYGERGAAFARSDSAWLVTLCHHSREHARQQIEWLGTVLSNRGMPRWLLELHLEILYRELSRAVPERTRAYGVLWTVSRELSAARLRMVPQEPFDRLSRDFAAHVGAPSNRWMVGTGRLLVAAVADEKAGMSRSVSRLVDWMTDPARFDEIHQHALPASLRELENALTPDDWARAIRKTTDEARRVQAS